VVESAAACLLCGVEASVFAAPIGNGFPHAARTDCSACGCWLISEADLPWLKMQAAEARLRISNVVRTQSDGYPGEPYVVTWRLIADIRGDDVSASEKPTSRR